MKSNVDRRRFRFGLKSNVDFMIQLDLETLINKLAEKSPSQGDDIPIEETEGDCSFANLMRNYNSSRYDNVCKRLKRLRSNLHFTQSLAEYFAMEDKIDPGLCVVNEALRGGPDMGIYLQGGSVASKALIFRHLVSQYDKDVKNHTVKKLTREFGSSRSFRHPLGVCFEFQKDRCRRKYCTFSHTCSFCKSSSHGYNNCPEKLSK